MASTARITTTIQEARLTALGHGPSGPLYLYLLKTGAKVQTQAAHNLSGSMVNVRTGNLRSSLHSTTEVRGALLVESVIADASYALAVHDGTQPHDIAPREKRVLAWPGSNGTQFATRVHHPGTTARPFLRNALNVL